MTWTEQEFAAKLQVVAMAVKLPVSTVIDVMRELSIVFAEPKRTSCATPGCLVLVEDGGHCDLHQRKDEATA